MQALRSFNGGARKFQEELQPRLGEEEEMEEREIKLPIYSLLKSNSTFVPAFHSNDARVLFLVLQVS